MTTIDGNLLRWQAMMTKVLQDTEGAPHRLFVAYEDLMQEPRAQLDRLDAFLQSVCGDPGRPGAMAEAVQPRLWRSRNNTSTAATAEQALLHEQLQALIRDPEAPLSRAIRMPTNLRDRRAIGALGPAGENRPYTRFGSRD